MSSFCISVICFHHINLEKNLSCCMNHLWGQMSGWGTSTSFIFSTPCNNIILIFIVINSFITTLVTYCHCIHSGWNIDEVMIFFRKHYRILRSLKVIIYSKKNHKSRTMLIFRLLCMYMIMSMLMSVVFILYICNLLPTYQVIKTLSCCMKDLWDQRSEWGLSLVTFWRHFVTTKSSFV